MQAFEAFKILKVMGDTANRDIGELITRKVGELLQSVNGKLVDLKISPDLSTSSGQALVTVFYNPGPEKKAEHSAKSKK